MLDHRKWNEVFLKNPGFNDAREKYGVTITRAPNAKWRVIGVHHLTGDENAGKHNVFCDVLDENGQRINGARLKLVQGHLAPVYATIDKPTHEPGTNFPIWGETPSSVSVDDEGSDSVDGLRINHADEEEGNTIGHHSFYVVFQRWSGGDLPDDPDPDPDPEPEPEPTPSDVGTMRLKVKHEEISKAEPDAEGFVTLAFNLDRGNPP